MKGFFLVIIAIAASALIAVMIPELPSTFAERFAPALELMSRQPMIELNDLLRNKIPPVPQIEQPSAKADRLAMGEKNEI